MKRLAAILGLLLAAESHAGSFGRYGVGVFEDMGTASPTKAFSLGYEEDWFGPFVRQCELGLYADPRGSDGRRSGGYGFISAGVEVKAGYLVLRSLWGLGAITHPDVRLGGPFQFAQDALVGVRGLNNNVIGINYKHISSAGIYSPNMGRDFVSVQVEIPW